MQTTTTNLTIRKQGQVFSTEEERRAAQEAFLEAYAEVGVLLTACKLAHIDYHTYQSWREDEWFADACTMALEEHREKIYAEVNRRGRQGILKPLVRNGQIVEHQGKPLYIREYSDRLLLAQLQRFFPLPQAAGAITSTIGSAGDDTYIHLPWDAMTEAEQKAIEVIGRNIDARMQQQKVSNGNIN